MKIKVTSPVLNYDGKPITERDSEEKVVNVTWRSVISFALNAKAEKESVISSEEKSQLYQLTNKIYAQNEPDLGATERAKIIEKINKIYDSPLICGRAKELLEDKKEK